MKNPAAIGGMCQRRNKDFTIIFFKEEKHTREEQLKTDANQSVIS